MSTLAYPRGSKRSLSENFTAEEFDCHCGKCKETLISDDLVIRLETLRRGLGCPVVISSGYRCHAMQENLRSAGYETSTGISTHEKGMAADIFTGHHSGAELEMAARASGFEAVGVGPDWIHVDTRGFHSWTYVLER